MAVYPGERTRCHFCGTQHTGQHNAVDCLRAKVKSREQMKDQANG